jgi:two-component system sensor histidine kinase VanS
VHSIVRAHDGTLALMPRPTGGLLVTIRLPGTPQGSSLTGSTRSSIGDPVAGPASPPVA